MEEKLFEVVGEPEYRGLHLQIYVSDASLGEELVDFKLERENERIEQIGNIEIWWDGERWTAYEVKKEQIVEVMKKIIDLSKGAFSE